VLTHLVSSAVLELLLALFHFFLTYFFFSSLIIQAVIGRYDVSETFTTSPETTKPPTVPDIEAEFSSSTDGEWQQQQSTTEATNYERIKVKKEILHPMYNRNSLRYDMMLVVLEHPPEFLSDPNNTFQFMRLHQGSSEVGDMIDGTITTTTTSTTTATQRIGDGSDTIFDDELIALGWGNTIPGRGPRADFLQEVGLGYVPNDICELSRENTVSYAGRIHEDMMCTFGVGRDSCNGTSRR
jgi:Trypsin